MTLDLVTVVFSKELNLLKKQARSIANCFETTDINKILILMNDESDYFKFVKKDWYAQHSNKVEFLSLEDIDYQYQTLHSGWYSQQLCKILASAKSTADWSCVLDAKTFWIKKYLRSDFFDNKNRARQKLSKPHKFWSIGVRLAEALFDLESNTCKIISPGGVPFFWHNKTIRNLLDYTIDIWSVDFKTFFERYVQSPVYLTEFLLYSAYVQYTKQYHQLYTDETITKARNLVNWQSNEFDLWFQELVSNEKINTISIKPDILNALSSEQVDQWNNFLQTKNIT